MANKRMFSKDIVAGSRFIMLSHPAQNLYFHLGVHADDDGYCEYVSVMRLIVADDKDLRILQESGFICVYDPYTLCIQDWYIHNKIPPSRYAVSKYLETFPDRDLSIKEQYNPILKACIQSVHDVSVESSIDKGSIDKSREDKAIVGEPKKPAKNGKIIELPDGLNKEAWAEWLQYKKEKKQKLTPSAITKQIKFLMDNKADHVAIINKSIMNNYTGLFPLNGDNKKQLANHLPAEEGKYDGY